MRGPIAHGSVCLSIQSRGGARPERNQGAAGASVLRPLRTACGRLASDRQEETGVVGEADSSSAARGAQPFSVMDCALVALATGRKARLLQEFRRELLDVEPSSIYHHFWGGLLQPRFEEREYNNDFAAWVRHGIHDAVLAERLAALDPTEFPDLEMLRRELVELVDVRLDEVEHLLWTRASQQFEFLRSHIVVFDTGRRLEHPAELAGVVPGLSTSSIFYHFIDARRRTSDANDDFSDWLAAFGEAYAPLRAQLAGVDPYFGSLSELRAELTRLFASRFGEAAP
jgi:hypothetical protein